MKNIIDRFRNKLAVALLFATVLAFFSGCSDSSEEAKSETASAKTCVVSGKVSVGSALPTAVLNSVISTGSIAKKSENGARSATATVSADGLEKFSVTAKKDTLTATGTLSVEEGAMFYSIALPTSGEWTITITAANDEEKVLLSGSVDASVTPEYTAVSDLPVTLTPVYDSEILGSIDLVISVGSSKVKNVSYKASIPASSENENSLDEKQIVDVADGKAEIKISDVVPNSYTVTFSFEDATGNTLYSCNEVISVFSGFTTDTWFGNSSYMKKGADGKYSFVITDELISKYDAEIVPSTNYLLYSAYSEEGNGTNTNGYRYYFVESPNETLDTASATTSLETSGSTMPSNSFCFDADGNYYALIETTSGYSVKSNKFTEAITIPSDIESLSGIMIDMKTNILYAWYGFQSIYKVYKFADLISLGSSVYETVPGGDFNDEYFYHDNTRLVINDGIVYGWVGSSIDGKLYTVDTSETSPNANFVSFSYSSLGLSGSESITDMLYQDGAVYLLARQFYTYSTACYSRGAVIRYDTVFGSFKVLGYSNTPNSATALQNAKIGAYHNSGLICEGNTLTKAIYVDGSHSWTNSMGTSSLYNCLPKFYTPAPLSSTLSNSEFYGPVKFVALKPKKLVIADDGLAFYIDTDNVLKYKNVNRVVTVDLESLSIIATNTTASLNGDSSDVKTCFSESSSTSYQGALTDIIPNSTIYYYNGSEFVSWNASASETQLGIPCKD